MNGEEEGRKEERTFEFLTKILSSFSIKGILKIKLSNVWIFNGKMQIDKGQVLIILSSVFIFVDRQKRRRKEGKSIIFKLIPTLIYV